MNHLTDAPQPSMNGTAEVSSLETSITTTTPDNAGLLDVPETAKNSEMLDLDALLAATSEELALEESTQREVSELMTQREALVSRTDLVQSLSKSRTERINTFAPLDGVTPQSYQRLAELKLTTPTDAMRMEQVAAALARIEQLQPTMQIEQRRTQLTNVQDRFHGDMDTELAGERVELAMRQGRARLTAQTLYTTRLHELEAKISAIDEDPRVQERLAIADAAIMAAQVEAERLETERVAQENRTTIESYNRGLHSVTSRQRTAIDRLSRALGNENLEESLALYAASEDDRARARYYTDLRNQIINQIINF